MSRKLLLPVLLFCGILFLVSCGKDRSVANVTLNETVQPGSTYALDLTNYGDIYSTSTITTQATNYSVSEIDKDPATRKDIYYFSSDAKEAHNEKVVIEVINKERGGCTQGGVSHAGKTIVTINLNVVK